MKKTINKRLSLVTAMILFTVSMVAFMPVLSEMKNDYNTGSTNKSVNLHSPEISKNTNKKYVILLNSSSNALCNPNCDDTW